MGEISPNLLLKPESIRNFIQLPGFLLLQKSLILDVDFLNTSTCSIILTFCSFECLNTKHASSFFVLVIDSRFECCNLTLHTSEFLIVGNSFSRNRILLVFSCFFESFIRNFQASKSTFATDIQSRFSTLHTVNLFIINYRYNFLHYSVKTFSYKQQVINKSYNLLMQMWRTWFVSVFTTKPLIWTIRKGIPLMSTASLEAVVIQEIIIVN